MRLPGRPLVETRGRLRPEAVIWAVVVLGLQGCGGSDRILVDLQPYGSSAEGTGQIRYAESASGNWDIDVQVTGLKPGASYFLSLHDYVLDYITMLCKKLGQKGKRPRYLATFLRIYGLCWRSPVRAFLSRNSYTGAENSKQGVGDAYPQLRSRDS